MTDQQKNAIFVGDSDEVIIQKMGAVMDGMSTEMQTAKREMAYRVGVLYRSENEVAEVVPTLNRALALAIPMLAEYGIALLDVEAWQPGAFELDGMLYPYLRYQLSVCTTDRARSYTAAESHAESLKSLHQATAKANNKR